jgi:hypothetical protein
MGRCCPYGTRWQGCRSVAAPKQNLSRMSRDGAPDQTVPYGTVLSRGRFPRHFVPGYGRLSLRDALVDIRNSI